MEMKNKLFRHHKSKFGLIARNFSMVFIGVFTLLSAVTIPTYLSVRGDLRIQMQASEEVRADENENNEDPVKSVEEETDSNQEN